MSDAVKKVVSFNPENVFSDIQAFLDSREMKSENTRIAYEGDIRQFFNITREKDIKHLVLGDLQFKHTEVLMYMKGLMKQYSNSSVNRKMACLKKFFQFLKRDHAELRPEVFDVDRLDESEVKSYGVLKWEEVLEMMELVKCQYKGEEKALLIEVAAKTSIRKDAILNLIWSNIRHNEKDDCWLVHVIDKGKKIDEKPISNDLYQRLQAIKKERNDDLVFHIDKKTCDAMMRKLCDDMHIEEDRHIVFHSLKKALINWVIDNGGTMMDAAKQGNHSNINTTYAHYMDRRKDFRHMPGLMVEGEIDFSKIESADSNELLEAIMASSPSVKAEILAKLKK